MVFSIPQPQLAAAPSKIANSHVPSMAACEAVLQHKLLAKLVAVSNFLCSLLSNCSKKTADFIASKGIILEAIRSQHLMQEQMVFAAVHVAQSVLGWTQGDLTLLRLQNVQETNAK